MRTAPMPANQGRGLEPVDARHVDVQQDDGKLVLQYEAQRFFPGARADDVLAQFIQDRSKDDMLFMQVVDHQDVDFFLCAKL